MPPPEEFKKKLKVSDMVKQYEEKFKPPAMKITLVRDVVRRRTMTGSSKKFGETYMQKLEKAKYTTWHVRTSKLFDGHQDKTYDTNSIPLVTNYQSDQDIENIENVNNYNEITLRSQNNMNESNGVNEDLQNGRIANETFDEIKSDDANQNLNTRISISDINILSQDSSFNTFIDAPYNDVGYTPTTCSEIAYLMDNDDCIDFRDKKMVYDDKPKIKRSSSVISWIIDSQFADELENFDRLQVPKFDQSSQTEDVLEEPHIPYETKPTQVDATEVEYDLQSYYNKQIDNSNNGTPLIKDCDFKDSVYNIDHQLYESEELNLQNDSTPIQIDVTEEMSDIQAYYNTEMAKNSDLMKEYNFTDSLQQIASIERENVFKEPIVQNELNYIPVDRQQQFVDKPKNSSQKHGYENIEIYRQNLKREIILIENIETLDDDDNDADNTEDDNREIPEIQYVNNTDIITESLMQYTNRNSNSLQLQQCPIPYFDVDEVDVAKSGIFGEGRFTIKMRTSYLEVINPLYNKNAPDQFFNEVNHFTSIPIDIAKYINKHKDTNGDGGSVNEIAVDSEYETDTSAKNYHTFQISCRPRCDSVISIGTLGSDDLIDPISDYRSSTEDVQPGSELIRTDSKLVRVDQTYYNNTLRITKNVVVKESPKVKPKSEHIVDELLKTECNNLSNLEYVRDRYMPEIQRFVSHYPHLIERSADIFINWHDIYLRACEFYERIEACGYNYEELAEQILKSISLFEAYSYYCKHKAKAERFLKEEELRIIVEIVQEKLGDKLGLSSYLLAPIQRLTKYKLLLDSLKKELIKTGECCHTLTVAIDMIKRITSESNDCIDASYIKDLPFSLKDQGRIIRKNSFNVMKVRPKTKLLDMKIFLFENVLIIAAPIKSSDGYIYKDHIFMDHMQFDFSDMPSKFIISDYPLNKKAKDRNYKTFICTHKSEDVATEWKNLINKNLMNQFHTLKDKANMIDSTMMKNIEIPKY